MAIAVMALCGEDYGGMGVNDAIIIHTFYLMVTLERISVMFPLLPPLCTCRRRLLFVPRRSPSNQGFTLFEVSVALMMSILFLTGTLNAMVVATIFQVKAERQAQASDWIQEDLEEVRAVAANYTETTGCPSGIGKKFNESPLGLGSLSITGTDGEKELAGKTYRIAREPNETNNISKITYRVYEDLNSNDEYDSATEEKTIIAQLYTEVLPAAALDCSYP
ncbi:MAG: hypothetical protein RLZZ568_2234 [Cyanobacteriota bacterium]